VDSFLRNRIDLKNQNSTIAKYLLFIKRIMEVAPHIFRQRLLTEGFYCIPVTISFLWSRNGIKQMRLFSIATVIVMALTFLLAIPDFPSDYQGLFQRFSHIGWSI